MRCPLCRIPAFRRLRGALARILALSVLLVLAACDQGADPLAPQETAGDPSSAPDAGPVDLATVSASRIAFMYYGDATETADIYTIGAGGGGLTRLTSWAGSEWDPTWSYDHQRLAFVRIRSDANNVQHSDIYLMNGDGSNKHWARSAPSSYDVFEPSWSPDGKRLVFTLRIGNGSTAYLATLNLATGIVDWVGSKGVVAVQGRHASYDPTGTSIIYLEPLGGAVHRLVPGGSDQILLKSDWQIRDATLSPDGKRLAYSRLVTSTNPEIFVFDLTTKVSKRLTFYAGDDIGATWSPDGTRIAFLSKRSGRYQVWSMSAATGGSLTQVTNVPGAEEPAWRH